MKNYLIVFFVTILIVINNLYFKKSFNETYKYICDECNVNLIKQHGEFIEKYLQRNRNMTIDEMVIGVDSMDKFLIDKNGMPLANNRNISKSFHNRLAKISDLLLSTSIKSGIKQIDKDLTIYYYRLDNNMILFSIKPYKTIYSFIENMKFKNNMVTIIELLFIWFFTIVLNKISYKYKNDIFNRNDA
jgi:hypothetical protein